MIRHGCRRPGQEWTGLDILDRGMIDRCSAPPLQSPSLRGRQVWRAIQTLIQRQPPAGDNPLCLIAPEGRAALLRDVADWARACGCTVFIRDGEALGVEIGRALEADSWDRLRSRVAAHDLVIVEGVEAIGNRQRLSAFRHLFDAAAAGGTRFCLSLAVSPTTGRLPEDLAGRLAGGLVLPLAHDEPSPAVRKRSPAAASARQPSLLRVFAATAKHYGISPETLVGPGRSRTVTQARSLAMYLARHLTDKSFSAIGRACGDRDHTTALHGMRITAARLASDPVLAADAVAILEALAPRTGGRSRDRSTWKPLSVSCR